MKNLFLLTMIISSLAQLCHLQAAEESIEQVIQAVQEKEERLAAMVAALQSPICNSQIKEIEKSLNEILQLKNPAYKKIYDRIFILRTQREQDDCCCVWWPYRSEQDERIEQQRTDLLKRAVAEVLTSQKK